jgi:hypothetical protein
MCAHFRYKYEGRSGLANISMIQAVSAQRTGIVFLQGASHEKA